jgi:diguanylate cyclase (GGDEF)-like protein/PAS domain S-box-containing protein
MTEAIWYATPFERVLVCVYASPISPGSSERTRVLEYGARGVHPSQENELLGFLESGGLVGAEEVNEHCSPGDVLFVRSVRSLPAPTFRIRSRRRYLRDDGWQSDDLVWIPIMQDGVCVGQISLDDPSSGKLPSESLLDTLRGLAALANATLADALLLGEEEQECSLLRCLLSHSVGGLVVTQGPTFCFANAQASNLLGYTTSELLQLLPWWQVIHPDDRELVMRGDSAVLEGSFTLRIVRQDGSHLWAEVQCRPMEYENHAAILLSVLDVTERVESEKVLKEKSFRDPLTGLFNRHYLEEAIEVEMNRSRRYKRPFTLVLADIAGFKSVNDRMGHVRGDDVLKSVACLIRDAIRDSDWAVRYGGDEFLLILPETGAHVETVVSRIEASLRKWAASNLPDLPLRLDMGWAVWPPEGGLSLSRLIQLADARMYEVKNRSNIATSRVNV